MNLPLPSPSRCLLLIGDDYLGVYNIRKNNISLVKEVPWQEDNFEIVVSTMLRNECGGKAVVMVNDMTDQHFKGGQRLPKVGPMDKAAVLNRRLNVAFPDYPIRGALLVKPIKAAGAKVKERRLTYLFSAVPMSDPVSLTINAVKTSLSPIVGFYLLPIESASMVTKLANALSAKKAAQTEWSIFVGRHKNGSLRQVVTRHGQLAMTRMTPFPEGEISSVDWAHEVSREFQATVSYLSRFGYSAEDGTDIIVISDREAGDALEKLIDIPSNYYSLTTSEAALHAGLNFTEEEGSQQFADLLHVAWIGKKRSFNLPMIIKDLEKIDKPRKAVAAAIVILMLSLCYLSVSLVIEASGYYSIKNDVSGRKKEQLVLNADLQLKEGRMVELGFDVELIIGSIDVFNKLESREMRPLPLLDKIGNALGDELSLDKLQINYVSNEKQNKRGISRSRRKAAVVVSTPELNAVLQLSFPSSINPEKGYRDIRDLKERLENVLSGYEINIEKQVVGRSYDVEAEGELGGLQKTRKERYLAEISIRGPAQ